MVEESIRVYLSKEKKLRFKAACTLQDRDMSDVVNELIDQWLAQNETPSSQPKVVTEQYRIKAGSDRVTLMALRERAGLTRRQVATDLGVTEKTIYVWETSKNPPRLTAALVQRMMEILNCSMEELVEATENRPQS